MRRLIASFLLVPAPASAKPTVLDLERNDFQGMANLIRFRKKVPVRIGSEGLGRIRGKLLRVSDTGVTISKKGPLTAVHTMIKKENLHSARMSPRWGNPWKRKNVAVIAAFPLWLVGLTVGLAIPDGIPEGRWHSNRHLPQGLAVGF